MKEIKLTKDQQKNAIEELKNYFQTEKDEEITDLSATLLLDFILENIGPYIYNQAIKDAQHFMSEKTEELFTLEKSQRKK